MMAELQARIGERASIWNGLRFEPNPLLAHVVDGPKSLLSRMGLDDPGEAASHAPASPPNYQPPISSETEPLMRHMATSISNVEQVNGKFVHAQESVASGEPTRQRMQQPLHGFSTGTSSKNEATWQNLHAEVNHNSPLKISTTSQCLASGENDRTPLIGTALSNDAQDPGVAHLASMRPSPPPNQISRLRDALVPVMMKNAQCRANYKRDVQPEEVQEGVREALSDEFCEAFREKMRSIQQQMLALRSHEPASLPQPEAGPARTNGFNNSVPVHSSRTPSPSKLLATITRTLSNGSRPLPRPITPGSASQSEPPTAPKAMRRNSNRESATIADGVLPETLHLGPNDRIPDQNESAMILKTPSSSASNVHDSHKRKVSSFEIAIPMDPAFFAPPGRNEKDPDMARSPRRRSPFPSRPSRSRRSLTPTPPRRQPSPETRPHRYRSPSPHRRYLSPSPLMRRARSRSPRSRSPPPYRRRSPPPRSAPTSIRSKRSRSPRSPRSPPPPSRHRLPLFRPHSPSPHRRRSPSPWARFPPSRRRRYSPYHTALSPLPHKRHPRDQQPILLDSQSSRRSLSLPEPSTVILNGSYEPVQKPVERSIRNDVFVSLPYAPVSIKPEPDIEDGHDTNLLGSPSPNRNIGPPTLAVPGSWLMQMGHDAARVLDCTFQVDDETAGRWDLLLPNSSGPPISSPKLVLQLICLSADLVETDPTLLENVASFETKTEWPKKGTLLIQVNPEHPWGRSWLPLEPSHPPLDLTRRIHKGTNLIRLIQLDDLTDKAFVLYASVPPEPASIESSSTNNGNFELGDIPQGTLDIPPATVEITWQ